MSARTTKTNHLGERRFHESPQILAEVWGAPSEFAQRLLTPARLVGAGALVLALVAGTLLILH